jgi:predicted transcriptional regulator
MLGTLEQKIMEILWNSEVSLKPSQVLEKLNHRYKYTTIMTVLKRMYDKHLLIREQKMNAFYYYPSKDKEVFAAECLDKLFNRLFSDYKLYVVERFKIAAENHQIKL